MKSRYKGANKSKFSLIKRILILAIIIGAFIFSERYVSLDESHLVTETKSIITKP